MGMQNDPLIGQVIDGRYEIKEMIGRGGMAVVYRAYQPSMERVVAVKVMSPDISGGEQFIERFKREARIIARLEHPHILPIFDFGEYNGQVYMVMRLLESGDLKDWMRSHQFTADEARILITRLASALTHAHDAGVIHRDLKPQNVLMDNSGNPYLMDFGIAKAMGATNQMTATGTIMGTPSYMAPEQWRSEMVDARTDIYALGIIAYALLTGHLPFEADTPFSLMYMHFDQYPQPLELLNSTLPATVTEVIFKAISKNPADRYASAVEFAAALDDAIQHPEKRFAALGLSPDFATFLAGIEHETGVSDSVGQVTRARPGIYNEPTAMLGEETLEELAKKSRGGGLPIPGLVLGLLLLGIIVAGLFFVFAGGDGDENGGGDVTEVAEIASPSATPTDASTLTETPAPTNTDTPIPTDTPTETLTPTPSEPMAAVRVSRGLIYVEPSTTAAELTVAPEGSDLEILGVSPDGQWYQVEFLGQTGWIFAQQVDVSGPVQEAPVIVPSETPTPTPTDTPTETETPSPTATFTPTETPSPTPTSTYTETPSPTPTSTYTETPSPTSTFTPSPSPTETFTPTQTPSPTPNVATAVSCILRAQSGEINVRSLPSTGANAETVAQIFGGDEVAGTAQTPDGGWFLTPLGWIASSVVAPSSETACGALPVIDPGLTLDGVDAGDLLCEVQTAVDVNLYRGASFGTEIVTGIPASTSLSVYEVAEGETGGAWYRTVFANSAGTVFSGWLDSTTAGPVAGSCPATSGIPALFGNPYSNALGLTEAPAFADNLSEGMGDWTLFPGSLGELSAEDGLLALTLNPRERGVPLNEANALAIINDGFLSLRLNTLPRQDSQYLVEVIVRNYYSLSLDEGGRLSVVAENNPSQVFGSVQVAVKPLEAGITLGIELRGEEIHVYVNGESVLEISDDTETQGTPGLSFRLRVSNISQEVPLTLFIDDIVFWPF
jgi:uncharacterized protein YraI